MNNQIETKETKNQLLEFNDDGFVKQLLITEKAKKSNLKPKINAEESGLNSSLIDNVRKFLEDAKRAEVDQKENLNNQSVLKNNFRMENDDLTDPNLEDNEEYSLENNFEINNQEEIGVEFDLLMYKDEDSDSEDED